MITATASFDKCPNPQGKGLVPVLQDWATMQPAAAGPKPPATFLRDYCISSLVLSAHFRFKPVIGQSYFLYANDRAFSLSLIAPHEWGDRKAGQFIARCRLQPDMTWDMDAADLDATSPALAAARTFVLGFVAALAEHRSISATLPFYVANLPYYQRLLATALASSLRRSLPATGDDLRTFLGASPLPLLSATFAPILELLPAGGRQ